MNAKRASAKFKAMVAKAIPGFRLDAIMLDPVLFRIYRKLSNSGDAILNETQFIELGELKIKMQGMFTRAKVCADPCIPPSKDMEDCPDELKWSLSPKIKKALATSHDQTLLLHLWKSYRDSASKPNRANFIDYVQRKNQAAAMDGKVTHTYF